MQGFMEGKGGAVFSRSELEELRKQEEKWNSRFVAWEKLIEVYSTVPFEQIDESNPDHWSTDEFEEVEEYFFWSADKKTVIYTRDYDESQLYAVLGLAQVAPNRFGADVKNLAEWDAINGQIQESDFPY